MLQNKTINRVKELRGTEVSKNLQQADLKRRFSGVGRLYTPEGQKNINGSHFIVVGLGGVGSWVVESLVRTEVGRITLIDLDNVAESNTNRQIQALEGNYGKPKVQALAERIALINPECRVDCIEDFIEPDNVEELLPEEGIIIDCIDNVRAKAAMINIAVKRGQPIITCGAAGGRKDPLRIKIDDLAVTKGDPLLSRVRARLRKEYGFPKKESSGKTKKFRVPAVFSDEEILKPSEQCELQTMGGLSCAGYGSGIVVTASVGLAASALALRNVAAGRTITAV